MTADTDRIYWMKDESWYRYNAEKKCIELTEAAPEKARISFELWKTPYKPKKGERRTI